MNKPNYKDEMDRRPATLNYLNLKNDEKKLYSGKKYFLRTYGCQMNVHDSEQIRAYLENMGFSEVNTLEESDIIVLNTCAIRENAKEKVFGFLGRAKHLKKTRKDLIIVLAGCLMQQPSEIEEIEKNHKYVDIVIGTHNIYELPSLIMNKLKKQDIEVYSNSTEVVENINYNRDSKITAWVNITYGCNNFCTYCIVPYTRGRERSRKPECIIKEVESLKNAGYKEVTLLGQNVNSYGYDFDNGYVFANLLEDVAKTGIDRVRFVTSNPWNFTDALIDVIAKYKNIMPYIHLPIQSGSNDILKKMNRPYTVEEYKTLFDKIKSRIPGVTVTTDIIVGFPNETDEDFKRTLDIVNYCQYDGAYTFIYSKRVGTIAAKMEDSTPMEVKEERLQTLNKLVNSFYLKSNRKYLDKIVPVLLLGKSEKDETKAYGYTDTFKLVNVETDLSHIGKIVNVKITDAKSFSLDGVEVDGSIHS
jgi:tRNA-2-methylthio-N6-dimethylallyladenosine synthase